MGATFRGGGRWKSDFDKNLAAQEAATAGAERRRQSRRQGGVACAPLAGAPSCAAAPGDSRMLKARWAADEISRRGLELARSANCNEGQIDIAAIAVSAICHAQSGDACGERFLIVHGAGGTGGTHVIKKVMRPLAREIFCPAGEGAAAVANSVARASGVAHPQSARRYRPKLASF